MAFRNPFKRHSKQQETANQVDKTSVDHRQSQEQPYGTSATHDHDAAQDYQKRTDVKGPQLSSQDPAPLDNQTLPPIYSTPGQSQPPRYRTLRPDPFDPDGPSYGYQYVENEQNFPHPSSVSKDIGKEMKYTDPKAADMARRASESGREDLTEMLNYHLRQQELGKKSIDNTIAAWNGV